jgi:hypothetical protein
VEVTWNLVLGYPLDVIILTRGWLCFVFKTPEDAKKVLNQVWLVKDGSLMLKKMALRFQPGEGGLSF